jgi:hypothetical protein
MQRTRSLSYGCFYQVGMKASNSATTHTAIDGLKAEAFEKLMVMEDNSERSNNRSIKFLHFWMEKGNFLLHALEEEP